MKPKLLVSMFVLLAFTPPAQAGLRVSNGGGAWVCRDRSTEAVRWLRLVDLFEAEVEYGLLLEESTVLPMKQVRAKLAKIRQVSPALASLLLSDDHALNQRMHWLPKGGTLTLIQDGAIRVHPSPSSCLNGYLHYGQVANFTSEGQLLLSSDLWNEAGFSQRDRAALLVHEIVYEALRARFLDQDSSRARRITGLLFSTLPAGELGARIAEVLAQPPAGTTEPEHPGAFRLACEAQLERNESGEAVTPVTPLTGSGRELSASLPGFGFFVRKGERGELPKVVKVRDVAAGSSVSIPESDLREAFERTRRISVRVEREADNVAAILTCWAKQLAE